MDHHKHKTSPPVDPEMAREALVLLEEERARHQRVMAAIEVLLSRALGKRVVLPISAEVRRPGGKSISVQRNSSNGGGK
ncbi:MAG TPA: hypothetical protein DCE18_09725 [Syntrophobacteraceae bacterium]|jgi:hypothetical protein|nr:hypothetical protein [Syntrophobacteraceae bacterium]